MEALWKVWNEPVRDHIPLEQGLRLVRATQHLSLEYVRDHIPLEQGLRHYGI